MSTILRTAFLFSIFALTVSAASEENITRQIDATPGGKLIVDVQFGSIDVESGADNQVTVEAHRKIDFGDEAIEKEYFSAVPVALSAVGNVITVRARASTQKSAWDFGHSETQGRYTIHVPKKFETDLRSDSGDVSVAEISGSTTVKTDGGKLAFRHLEGGLNANTSGGSIEVEDCRGPTKIETSGGDIAVAAGTGTLDARTSGGRIDVRNFFGATHVTTSGGNLELRKISGEILGKTSGGSIHAAIRADVMDDVRLETSAGNIDVALSENATVDIDASTIGGNIFSGLPLETTDAHSEHLRGRLNGGGTSVKLQTSAGNITIEAPSSEVASR
jgi:Putative adhesin